MYLSRIELDARLRETQRALSSPQIMHAAVQACFPREANERSRNLWRIDKLDGTMYLLLQSREKPDHTHIAQQFCLAGMAWEIHDYEPILSNIKQGQTYRFRLTANPSHRMKSGNAYKIVSHATIEHQLEWLLGKPAKTGLELQSDANGSRSIERLPGKAEKSGFKLYPDENGNPIVDITQSENLRFRRGNTAESSMNVEFIRVTYEGVLQVTDCEAFVLAMRSGIGREKAYGCGLLTLAGV